MNLEWWEGDHERVAVDTISTARRWSMLVIALFATLSANVFINGVAFLIPTLHTTMGLDLARAGLVSAMPSFGMVLTLIAWGTWWTASVSASC